MNEAEVRGTLLVPVANRETAERQLDTAIELATDRSLRIVLVHVVVVPSQLRLVDGREYVLDEEDEAALEAAVDAVERRGVVADSLIVMGRGVAGGISWAASEVDADVILAGWRGRPPREGVVLGSYLDTVLADAGCDVLVQRIQEPRPADLDSILVAVGGGPHAEFAAETAASLAREHDATVRLVHGRSSTDPEQSSLAAEGLLADAADGLEGVDVERVILETGDVPGTITDLTADHDLTLLGVTEGGFLKRRLLGSLSDSVARHAAGTVILAKRHESTPSRLRRLLG